MPNANDRAGARAARSASLGSLGAPTEDGALTICPHCWHVNRHAARLCGRCGADMTTALQESGGLRLTAPVQSPVPVRVGGRLSTLQRVIVLFAIALLGFVSLVGVFAAGS